MEAVMRSGWERIAVQFENKITTGTLLQLAAMIGAVMVFMLNYEHRMTQLEARQEQILSHLEQQDRSLSDMRTQLQGRVIPAGKPSDYIPPPP